MNNVLEKSEIPKFKYLKVTPQPLKDGTLCYTVPIRYPKKILNSLKKILLEKDFNNMTDAIFYCIENHEKNKFLNSKKIDFKKENLKNLTIRFRENHCRYIEKICETKNVNFTDGVLYILYEYLVAEKRL